MDGEKKNEEKKSDASRAREKLDNAIDGINFWKGFCTVKLERVFAV